MDQQPDTRLQATAPRFHEKLAALPTLAGWVNPNHPEEAALTREANQWIAKLTHAIEAMGYQPYSGVEVNFAAKGPSTTPTGYEKYVISETTRARKEAGLRLRIEHMNRHGGWPMPLFKPGLPAQEADGAAWMRELLEKILDPANAGDAGLVSDLQLCQDSLRPWLHPQMIAALNRFLLDPSLDTRPGIISDQINTQEHEFTGKTHVDSNNMELVAPPADPLTTIRRTMRIKSLAWQATWDYDQLYVGCAEEIANPASHAPIDPVAEKLLMAMGAHNIRFSGENGSTGEHLNLSLKRCTPGRPDQYFQALKDKQLFIDDNVLTHKESRLLLAEALEDYLPHDTLMALGNTIDLTRFCPEETIRKGHEIRSDKASTTEGSRIELRTFNTASSNLSLSMLSALSVIYATLQTIHAHPDIEGRFRYKQLTPVDVQVIRNAMHERWPADKTVDDYMVRNIPRFREHSLTLATMRELAEQEVAASGETLSLTERFDGIDRFADAIVSRTRRIQQQPVHSAAER
jgi:hypothetical protein